MKEFVCITCPNSCRMQAELENGQWKVTGNKCKRGQQFAESEMTCPKRKMCIRDSSCNHDQAVAVIVDLAYLTFFDRF